MPTAAATAKLQSADYAKKIIYPQITQITQISKKIKTVNNRVMLTFWPYKYSSPHKGGMALYNK
jgi:hypothetical protein